LDGGEERLKIGIGLLTGYVTFRNHSYKLGFAEGLLRKAY